jgi:peptidoglycan/LPS O-acetylase OafA/YrhL
VITKLEGRLHNIDTLRAIAAFSVLWFHVSNTVSNYPVNTTIRESGAFGWIGVDIFFVISGFIIPFSLWKAAFIFKEHWRSFLFKRLIRIEPTYILSIIFTIVFGLTVNYFYSRQIYVFSFGQIAAHFLYLNAFLGYEWVNPVYWTLAIEFQYYILICFLYPVLFSRTGRLWLILGSICMACLVKDSAFIFSFGGLFLIGIFIFLYYIKSIDLRFFIFAILCSVLFAVTFLGYVAAIAGLATGLLIIYVRIPKYSWVTYVGMISYSLYLFHYPIVEKIVRLGKHVGNSTIDQIFVVTIATLISIIVARFFFVIIERPTMKLSHQISYQSTLPSVRIKEL